jgi:hypothetical protein
MIGKNIKLKIPDGTEKDLKEIRFIHVVFEKPDNKIIKYSDGQISGNYLQIEFQFGDNQNFVFVTEKAPTPSNTELVGIPAAYQGKSLHFSVDQTDKAARIKIASTSTVDGSKWDTIYEGVGTNASEIKILNGVLKPEEYKLPAGVMIKDWGGNIDNRDSWTTAAMKEKQGLWKVVDSQPKNIAAEFKTQQEAQQFIDYLRKHPEKKPSDLQPAGPHVLTAGQFPFPADPAKIRFNQEIVDQKSSDGGDRQELDVKSGSFGDGPRAEGAFAFYVKHKKIGEDQYSIKWGFGGNDGEYEHITQLGGKGGGDYRSGWRWEAKHKDYTPSGDKPTHISNDPQMRERVENDGLCMHCEDKQQGFMIIKTRSPGDDATVYDVYVDDGDQSWTYAFSNKFLDNDDSNDNRRNKDCCDQTNRKQGGEDDGENYRDSDMRIEVRFQDQDEDLEFPAADYKTGRPQGYTSPLFANT